MRWIRLAYARLYGWLRKSSLEREIDEELRFHLAMRAQENIARGMSPDAARRDALKRFGRMERIKEACRDVKGGGIVETLWQDLRYGARALVKNPGFTAVAVITLALGIGANTAIFSVVNSVLLKPLPYPEPERIYEVNWAGNRGQLQGLSGVMYEFWKEHSQSFSDAAGLGGLSAGFNLAGGAEPQRVRGVRVSEGLFRVLGVGPVLGRGFLPEEDRPNGPCAAVISDRLWRSYFGGDMGAVGRQVELNGQACAVAGVLPPDFQFAQFAQSADVFMPLQLRPHPRDQGRNTPMIVRLRPGVTVEQAHAEMAQLLPQFHQAYPNHVNQQDMGPRLVPYHESIVGGAGKVLWLLLGAVGFVLAVACANVANLLLARATNRSGEMAVRIALGAGRLRLIRQLMTENLLLALVGGALGLLLAMWAVPALVSLSPPGLPRVGEISLDASAIIFAVLASCVTCLFFGLAPALQATRLDVNQSLKATAGRSGGRKLSGRLRALLVVSEVALSIVLLVGAALFVKSFLNLHAVDVGFNPQNLTAMQVSLNSERYRTAEASWNLQRQVLERIAALPGVEAAASVPSLPLERGLNYFVMPEGAEQGISAEMRTISPDYFRTLGITLLRGRAFADNDTKDTQPVIIVNESFARRFWPDEDPLGRRIVFNDAARQIVGLVPDLREIGLDKPTRPTIYVPVPQVPDGLTAATNRWFLTSWLIRTREPQDLGAALRAVVREVDPQLPIANIRPMTEVIGNSVAAQRFLTTLMGIFAGLALMLTAVGLYGVLSYQVSQRTQEIGIRMALGARARDVIRLVVSQGMLLALIGVGIGLAAAFALTRLISSLLFGVSATDPASFALIACVLLAVALLACLIPARRATRVDPMIALRYE